MNKFIKTNPSLIDFIEAENELLDVRAINNGFRFRFSERVLPPFFFELAHRFGYAVKDDDATQQKSGRTVSLINTTKE